MRRELGRQTGQSGPLKDDVAHRCGRQWLPSLLAPTHATEDGPPDDARLADPGLQGVSRFVEDGFLTVVALNTCLVRLRVQQREAESACTDPAGVLHRCIRDLGASAAAA